MSSFPTVIIQARMGSTRLPGKTLMPVLGRPLLSHLIERLKHCHKIAGIAVATTTLFQDHPIADLAMNQGVAVIRGDEADVLSRYLLASKDLKAASLIRITADCPLMDPEVVDFASDLFMTSGVDYVSNTQVRTYPRGLDVEVFSSSVLERIAKEAVDSEEREHVTLFIHRHPGLFSMKNFCYSVDASHLRLTVDTEEDFTLIQKIINALYPLNPSFKLRDILLLMEKHPEWEKINKEVRQK